MKASKSKAARIFEEYIAETKASAGNRDSALPQIESVQFEAVQRVSEIFHSVDWSFADNRTSYLSHDLHPYPAKFVPQLPARVIQLLSSRGELVWDPFGGSGTTAVEALLNDRCCISTDVNPIGAIIGKAKTTSLRFFEEDELEKFIGRLEFYGSSSDFLKEYFDTHQQELSIEIPPIPNIEKWFCSTVICELAFIKRMIKTELKSGAAVTVAQASLSKIITKVSNQESETRYRAVERNAAVGETICVYLHDLRENFAKVKVIGQLLEHRSARFITANVMDDIIGEHGYIRENEVDLVVTSPPYPNAFDYHLYHRFRIFWLDGDPVEMGKAEIGSHLKYQRNKNSFEAFEKELTPVLINCCRALKPGRYAVFVLGDAVFGGVLYKTAERIGRLAESLGFEFITIVDRPLPENKRSVKARRATGEQILVLRKPCRDVDVTLHPAGYKLWYYEQEISDLELSAITGVCGNSQRLAPCQLQKLKKLTFFNGYSIGKTSFKTWQSVLEQGYGGEAARRKDPKYVTHGIHPYKGKFYPQLVRPLLNILAVPVGGTVFDPFCGSGTVALEAILNGYSAFGCDINPIAAEIAKAKTGILSVPTYEFEKHVSLFIRDLNSYRPRDYRSVFSDEAIKEIDSWFPKKVVDKMGFIIERIKNVPDERIKCFLRVILSSIIREISQQDPSDLRIRRRKEAIDDAPVIELYLQNLNLQYDRIIEFHEVRNAAPEKIQTADIWLGNSKYADKLWEHLPKEGVDVVITSPPYATALPYIDTSRLNLLVLNGLNASMRVPIEAEMTGTREIRKTKRQQYEALIRAGDYGRITSGTARELIQKIYVENENSDVGFRKKNMAALLYMYFDDMSRVMASLDRVVKHRGHICIVIGDTKTTTGTEKTTIKTTAVLRETGRELGWTLIRDIPISVTVEKYLHMSNSITENNILVFQRP